MAHGFRAQFDDYLQALYSHALQQARDFVEFVAPEPGWIVIEVGCGSGRIAFDGRLAERLGPSGQLLLTDPSVSQLNACARRVEAAPAPWVRVMRAAAEQLPVASETADVVMAVSVLQFTDQARALAEMCRVTKVGGSLALSTALDYPWPPAWQEVLAPVRAALAEHGLEYRPFLPTNHDLRSRVERAGLRIDRSHVVDEECLEFPDADLAIGLWQQSGLVPLLLRDLPTDRHEGVQEAFDEQLRAMFARTSAQERRITMTILELIARRTA